MKKTIIAAAVAGGLSSIPAAYAHNDEAYSHDYKAVGNQPQWMARVPGEKRVSELSLPGTHDTMSIKSGDIWQNQTMTLMQQLNSGLRVFDMRVRHVNNRYRMHHGIIDQDTYFDDVLRDINDFLAANPSETVLFRLKRTDGSGNSRSYNDTLDEYLLNQGERHYTGHSDNPTLDEIRGKFVIMQEFGGADYGIPYSSLDIQDDFSLTTNWDLYDKWTSVKNHINKATNGDRDTIYMNYLSGANGSFPYFVVSGHSSPGTSAPRLATGLTTPGWKNSYPDFPRTTCFIGICTISFEGTNTLTADYIEQGGFTGMVMTDFPGERLINNIINLNDLSDYHFDEFSWGQATDESVNLCASGKCLVEGDQFAINEPAPKGSLSVVSYNVLRPSAERIQNQVNYLKEQFGEQGPDVILLSETVRGDGCGSGRNTAREYAKAFNAYYVNANEDGDSASCQTGNAIVSRYPMGNVSKVRFKAQHSSFPGTGETDTGRSFVVADLKVGDDIVHVYSTHSASPFGIPGDNARKGQHAEMVYHAKSKPFTRILGGDLNAVGHIFADPLGLHDISLNPIFDDNYTDAHDDLATHKRITSEAGLVDNDWTLLLDFIFVKGGKVLTADLCGSECRDSSVLSDHVPIWADIQFEESNLASLSGGIDIPEDYRLQVEHALGFDRIWTDAGSGADDDVSIWRPNGVDGFYRLGDYAVGSHNKPSNPSALVAKDDGSGALAKPAGYSRAWRDAGSGADQDVSLWKPVAPAGYQCLGFLATSGAKPDSNDMRCVWRGLLSQGGSFEVWDDSGSGADADVGIYQAYAYSNDNAVATGTFNATGSHSHAGDFKQYQTLNMSKIQFTDFRELKVMGKCMDVPADKLANNEVHANAYVWDCWNPAAWQKWGYEESTGFIRSKHNRNMCLDSTNGNSAGTNVVMHPCVDHINLKWDFVGDTIRPRKNHGLALDLSHSDTSNGANLLLWYPTGNANQSFSWGSR